ncbi:DUF2971 domain-containing protein [Pseudomonas amygdali]|uniref:DUF2971 domain-containing protein n=2 Tax=Pseudomonas amygdali pv. lachrymans TaxID=53707 RepID=A0ABR5KSJ3_PSEAV|nr:DUF2971 domain-containing protein [Pseudomonas amygdali]AXH60205.1 hypothetical protein PLA107_034020 [Pseudomonas amygdali pv. lachrymans str. M301315]KPC17604.1 Uncharacterized protein AC499_0806 [Pseudomonas amygdali pv. lachrymans]RMT05725.1 hypothetical protein ALP54_04041 [Pseudomonas amygdali pv. lachrymans]
MKVYKYFPKNRALDLANNKFYLRFTQPAHLNDGFEFSPEEEQDSADFTVELFKLYDSLFRTGAVAPSIRLALTRKPCVDQINRFIYANSFAHPKEYIINCLAAATKKQREILQSIHNGKFNQDLKSTGKSRQIVNKSIQRLQSSERSVRSLHENNNLEHYSEVNQKITKAFAECAFSVYEFARSWKDSYLDYFIDKNQEQLTRNHRFPLQMIKNDGFHEVCQAVFLNMFIPLGDGMYNKYEFMRRNSHHKFGILSLGMDIDNPELWDNYSSSIVGARDGYCIEFDLDEMFDFSTSSSRVHYYSSPSERRNQRNEIHITNRSDLSLDGHISSARLFQKPKEGIDVFLGTERSWENEKEFRVVAKIDDSKPYLNDSLKYRLLPYNPKSITAIKIGDGADQSLVDIITQFCKSHGIKILKKRIENELLSEPTIQ